MENIESACWWMVKQNVACPGSGISLGYKNKFNADTSYNIERTLSYTKEVSHKSYTAMPREMDLQTKNTDMSKRVREVGLHSDWK